MDKIKSFKAIIADDERLVRERVRDLLSSYDDIDVSASCSEGESTIKEVQSHRPDLLFLDIKMPKGGGFDVLNQIEYEKILIVFITAYDRYAIKAFEYAAFDYLLKPITKDRFDNSMKRVLKSLHNRSTQEVPTIMISNNRIVRKIFVQDISHLEAADNYVKIHSGPEVFKKRITLRKMIKKLSESGFIQVHRSFVIHPRHIHDMVRIYQGDYLIKLSNGRVIPTSKSFRPQVKALLAI